MRSLSQLQLHSSHEISFLGTSIRFSASNFKHCSSPFNFTNCDRPLWLCTNWRRQNPVKVKKRTSEVEKNCNNVDTPLTREKHSIPSLDRFSIMQSRCSVFTPRSQSNTNWSKASATIFMNLLTTNFVASFHPMKCWTKTQCRHQIRSYYSCWRS